MVIMIMMMIMTAALLQMCFWRGNMEDGHRDDVFKEYSVWKVPGKPGGGLRRSLRCATAPAAPPHARLPRFPERPEAPLDLANMVPASPLPGARAQSAGGHHNGFHSEPPSRHVSPAISGYDRLQVRGFLFKVTQKIVSPNAKKYCVR